LPMKILILNGPNLNQLGKRDPDTYGTSALGEIQNKVAGEFPDFQFEWFQSNHEGELIDRIQQAEEDGYEALIGNWGGFTHTSVAIRDALDTVEIPKVEIHLSNIHAREEFRERSITGEVMDGIITGFGHESYILGVHAAILTHNKT
ncbi:MAG: type II 3-dehydroquinate dehydratase, partial [Balneolaceae bacterium]